MTPEDRIQALRKAPSDGWVAFSADESRLVAYGSTYEEAVARQTRVANPTP
jgi:predicted RNase H-like HicB family nuclease